MSARASRGEAPAQIARALAGADPAELAWLASAATTGETYFFRHPEHFDLLVALVVPALAERRRAPSAPLRVWSAGCSTGEETYSLAAALTDATGGAALEVIGTDVATERLLAAERGRYSEWSARSPLAYRCLAPLAEGGFEVRPGLRALASFRAHNLLDPWPGPPFDLVVCRNVLAYLRDEARAQVVQHLADAVLPGGYLLLGPLDLPSQPSGFVAISVDGATLLARSSLPAGGGTRAPPDATPVARGPVAPIRHQRHRRALAALEQGDDERAARLLEDLVLDWPEYLPGALELAMLWRRRGETERSRALMRVLARQARSLPDDQLVEGPVHTTVAFYRRAAAAFLGEDEGAR